MRIECKNAINHSNKLFLNTESCSSELCINMGAESWRRTISSSIFRSCRMHSRRVQADHQHSMRKVRDHPKSLLARSIRSGGKNQWNLYFMACLDKEYLIEHFGNCKKKGNIHGVNHWITAREIMSVTNRSVFPHSDAVYLSNFSDNISENYKFTHTLRNSWILQAVDR